MKLISSKCKSVSLALLFLLFSATHPSLAFDFNPFNWPSDAANAVGNLIGGISKNTIGRVVQGAAQPVLEDSEQTSDRIIDHAKTQLDDSLQKNNHALDEVLKVRIEQISGVLQDGIYVFDKDVNADIKTLDNDIKSEIAEGRSAVDHALDEESDLIKNSLAQIDQIAAQTIEDRVPFAARE